MIEVEPHPLLDLWVLRAAWPAPLASVPSAAIETLSLGHAAPVAADDAVRLAVRDLLRHGGFKPSGRSKPASEYLRAAADKGELGSIDAAVDACNGASLHGGLPVSIVDLDRAVSPLRVAVAPAGSSYVFNRAGQTIDLGGLLCLFDAEGPCGSPVKDSQRTKTTPDTRRTISLVWGVRARPDLTAAVAGWHGQLLVASGAVVEIEERPG